MQRAQRTFGRFLKRTPNEADVDAMLSDFNDSESMLEKVRESCVRQWQSHWVVTEAGTGGVLSNPPIASPCATPGKKLPLYT
jgi:hypothetical protein